MENGKVYDPYKESFSLKCKSSESSQWGSVVNLIKTMGEHIKVNTQIGNVILWIWVGFSVLILFLTTRSQVDATTLLWVSLALIASTPPHDKHSIWYRQLLHSYRGCVTSPSTSPGPVWSSTSLGYKTQTQGNINWMLQLLFVKWMHPFIE